MKNTTMLSMVENYLELRRHLGFELKVDGRQLERFAKFSDNKGHHGPLTLELAIEWARSGTSRQITSARRIEVLRPFAKYLAQREPLTEIPPRRVFGEGHRRLVPHIFEDSEIRTLLIAAGTLPPSDGLRPKTYQTLFGLLAATGMRISEALHLECKDVDLNTGIITIRRSKFQKSRLIPLHSTTVDALRNYEKFRNLKIVIKPNNHYLLLDGGLPLRQRTANYRFECLRKQLCWKARGEHSALRIQDLRHNSESLIIPSKFSFFIQIV